MQGAEVGLAGEGAAACGVGSDGGGHAGGAMAEQGAHFRHGEAGIEVISADEDWCGVAVGGDTGPAELAGVDGAFEPGRVGQSLHGPRRGSWTPGWCALGLVRAWMHL